MKSLLGALSEILAAVGRLLWPFQKLKVSQSGPSRLSIESRQGDFILDARRKSFSRNGRLLARFEQIRFVEVIHVSTDESGDHWEVRVQVDTRFPVHIGSTDDDAEASILAARLSSLVGCRVLASRESRSGLSDIEIEL